MTPIPKLVLYSGGQERENAELHRRLISLARSPKPLTMTYVPYCSAGSQDYFRRAIRRYAPFGVVDFLCLDLERNPTQAQIREALRSQIVYLAGGNTFFFLHHLKRLGLLPALRSYVRKGGVLAGLSAGGLIMTPTIRMAGEPSLEPDENEVGLKDLKALGLVSFEFSPHFSPSRKNFEKHVAYSKRSPNPIYASRDGGGIVVLGREISFVGPTWAFFRGRGFRVN